MMEGFLLFLPYCPLDNLRICPFTYFLTEFLSLYILDTLPLYSVNKYNRTIVFNHSLSIKAHHNQHHFLQCFDKFR